MRVTIIGLGLLGGSFSLALKEHYPNAHIIGVENNPEHAKIADERKLIDEILPLKQGLESANFVVLAIPVDAIVANISEILDLINDNTVVTDFGSTKELICETIKEHPKRSNFIAAHPIAGTEDSGPKAALSSLLRNKMMILCDVEKSDPSLLKYTEKIFSGLEMTLQYMSAKSHDLHIAFVSHLSHISSFALGNTVLEKEKDEKNIFIMAGSGFSSTVRLAKSSPDMWNPIFEQNKGNISKALELYIDKLSTFKKALDEGDSEKLYNFMKETNDIRRVLKGD